MQPTFQTIVNFLYVFLKVSDGRSFPPALTPEQEHDYFTKWKTGGDETAREKLIEHNLRLVAHIVKKYATSQNQEDLISIGTIGLIKAVDTFKMENGARFATYASRCMTNEILMHFRATKKREKEVGIDEPIDRDKDGNAITYSDIIYVDGDITEEIYVKNCIKATIACINENLTKREKDIILLRYGLGDRAAITQREVAKQMDISRSYVSRIETAAMKKIEAHLKNQR
ncbi:MAG: RNA polymerase sporulation sigma factor SigK [Oscillospiraceae bacterium]|nr:RNA polymerase sporulation sigma factor SigK [Oscillospiraceae bacterium]